MSLCNSIEKFHKTLQREGMNHKSCPKFMIILGDGGHRGMGYVTPASAVQLFSKLCKLFDRMTSR